MGTDFIKENRNLDHPENKPIQIRPVFQVLSLYIVMFIKLKDLLRSMFFRKQH